MPYAAAITSAEHAPKSLLEKLAPSFASAIATIRRRESEWILELFRASNQMTSSDEQLYGAANKIPINKYISCWRSTWDYTANRFPFVLS